MKIKLLGDTAIIIYYENPDNSSSFAKVQNDYALLKNSVLAGIKDIVPCYSSIGIYFDQELIKLEKVMAFVTETLSGDNPPQIDAGQTIHIPVYYGGVYGPDLAFVADTLHLSQEEVILAADNDEAAAAVVDAVLSLEGPALVALAGSKVVRLARTQGLPVLEEGFADRRYKADGTLLERSFEQAVISDPSEAAKQVLNMVKNKKVTIKYKN